MVKRDIHMSHYLSCTVSVSSFLWSKIGLLVFLSRRPLIFHNLSLPPLKFFVKIFQRILTVLSEDPGYTYLYWDFSCHFRKSWIDIRTDVGSRVWQVIHHTYTLMVTFPKFLTCVVCFYLYLNRRGLT